jgi:hypothetical protein
MREGFISPPRVPLSAGCAADLKENDTMPTGPECQVERCKFPATKMHRLKERSGPFDFPTDFVVCDIHKDKLSDSATEWVLLNEHDGRRRLLVGPMLAELNEFIVLAPINSLTMHAQSSRVVSHPEHNGYHVQIRECGHLTWPHFGRRSS